MKIVRALVKYILIFVGVIFLSLLLLTAIYKDRVAEIFINEINNNTQVRASISSSHLSLLRRFPRASFTLKDVVVYSAPGFAGNDTLVAVSEISLDFNITDLIKRRYNIAGVSVTNGIINISTDSAGLTNYPAGKEKNMAPGSGIAIDLNNIRLAKIYLTVTNSIKQIESEVMINSARLNGRIAGTNIGMKAAGDFRVEKMSGAGILLKNPLEGSVGLQMNKTDSAISMESGTLKIETMSFEVAGSYNPESRRTSLLVSAVDVDIVNISGFLPEKYSTFGRFRPDGKISAILKADGLLTKESMLHYEVSFSVSDAKFAVPGTDIRLTSSSLKGFYTNGALNNARSSHLNLTDINLISGPSFLSGSISMTDFSDPVFKADIVTLVELKVVIPLFKSGNITAGEGTVRSSLSLGGSLPDKGEFDLNKLLSLNPAGNFYFSNAGFNIRDYSFRDIDGNLMLSKTLWIDSLSLNFNEQRMEADGEISNFIPWLRGIDQDVIIVGSLSANLIDPSLFLGMKEEETTLAPVFMPQGFDIRLHFTTAEFRHKTFRASDVTGFLDYSSNVARLDTFSLSSMGGEVNGSASMVRNKNGSYSSNSSVNFRDIDINSAFLSFNNFSQSFILAENLKGSVSGRNKMLMDLDSFLLPVNSSISSVGQFSIINGELINFEPVKSMSKFIDISELENIKFSKLENEYFIANETFAIPQMEINSSAVDLGISGKHLFNGNYEYHVRLFLSQILSKKAPRKSPNNEFGIVEDDGYGRTSLFLKLTKEGDKETVAFDMAATKADVKESLRDEKKSLRTILNEEYGWYAKDSTATQVKEQKPKFRIIWDEGAVPPDTIKPDTIKTSPPESKIKGFFNKIIKG